ncbi:hypothetical protein GGF50DRAFT_105967 [Schizophyllum commune]
MICCRLFSLIGAVWAAGVDMKRVVGNANLYFIIFSCPANSRGVDGTVSSAALVVVEVRDLGILWVALIDLDVAGCATSLGECLLAANPRPWRQRLRDCAAGRTCALVPRQSQAQGRPVAGDRIWTWGTECGADRRA